MNIDNLAKIRDFYLSNEFFNDNYMKQISPLIRSFDPNKGVPLDIENPSDYYTTTTTTTLLALYYMNLLDERTLTDFHEVILKLRDTTVNSIRKPKSIEDAYAWDVAESAFLRDHSSFYTNVM